MRVVTLLGLASVFVCLACADGEATEKAGGEPLARCVKVLKYGPQHEYYGPAKGDAVVALGLLGDERAVPVLVEHLANEEDRHLRFQIVKALGWIKSPKAVPALEKALKDNDEHIRKGAALALKAITGKDYPGADRPARPGQGAKELLRELARLEGAAQDAAPARPFLEAGKTYRFAFARPQSRNLAGKVLEVPADHWVKVQVRTDEKSITSWVNLNAVESVTLEAGER